MRDFNEVLALKLKSLQIKTKSTYYHATSLNTVDTLKISTEYTKIKLEGFYFKELQFIQTNRTPLLQTIVITDSITTDEYFNLVNFWNLPELKELTLLCHLKIRNQRQ